MVWCRNSIIESNSQQIAPLKGDKARCFRDISCRVLYIPYLMSNKVDFGGKIKKVTKKVIKKLTQL